MSKVDYLEIVQYMIKAHTVVVYVVVRNQVGSFLLILQRYPGEVSVHKCCEDATSVKLG